MFDSLYKPNHMKSCRTNLLHIVVALSCGFTSAFGLDPALFESAPEQCKGPRVCAKAEIQCLPANEVKRKCRGGQACAKPGSCLIYMSENDCAAAGVGSGTYDIDRLMRLITDPSIPTTYAQALERCKLVHELKHLLQGCEGENCSKEIGAYAEQLQCMQRFVSANCGARDNPLLGWSEWDCETARIAICEVSVNVAVHSCRCRIGAPDSGDTCTQCIADCERAMADCTTNPQYNRDQCQRQNEAYCDGRPIPRPTPSSTPVAQPTIIGGSPNKTSGIAEF